MKKVIVLFNGHSSASPLKINASSRNTCEIIFLVNNKNFYEENLFRYVRNKTVFLDFSDNQGLIKLINEIKPDGIITFCEEALDIWVWLSNFYKLKGNSEETIINIINKFKQRTLLNKVKELNVNHMELCTVEIEDLKESNFPVIVKPIRGFGSKEVFKVDSKYELNKCIKNLSSDQSFYIEEFLKGKPMFSNSLIGDYVSVESISNSSIHTPVAITLKLSQNQNFAETGMFVCDCIDKNLEKEIKKVAVKALEALSFENGVTHTEIKLTNDGPKIIEVNARLGGYVGDLVKKKYGIDLINIALQLSFKNDIEYKKNNQAGIFYQKFIIPELLEDSMLVKVLGVDRSTLNEISGNLIYEKIKDDKSIIKKEDRTQRIVGIAYGQCAEFSSFLEEIETIETTIKPLLKEKLIE